MTILTVTRGGDGRGGKDESCLCQLSKIPTNNRGGMKLTCYFISKRGLEWILWGGVEYIHPISSMTEKKWSHVPSYFIGSLCCPRKVYREANVSFGFRIKWIIFTDFSNTYKKIKIEINIIISTIIIIINKSTSYVKHTHTHHSILFSFKAVLFNSENATKCVSS